MQAYAVYTNSFHLSYCALPREYNINLFQALYCRHNHWFLWGNKLKFEKKNGIAWPPSNKSKESLLRHVNIEMLLNNNTYFDFKLQRILPALNCVFVLGNCANLTSKLLIKLPLHSDLASARHFCHWWMIFESGEFFLCTIRLLIFRSPTKKYR